MKKVMRRGLAMLLAIILVISLRGTEVRALGIRQDNNALNGSIGSFDFPVQKVLVISFDPVFPMVNNKYMHELNEDSWLQWNDPAELSRQYIAAMKECSHGNAKYEIAEWITIDDLPQDINGQKYTREDYYRTLQEAKNSQWDYWDYKGWKKFGTFDYNYYLSLYHVYERVEQGEFNEVWFFSGPCTGAGMYETVMVGRGAYFCNGETYNRDDCPAFVCYGFNFERDLGCMLEDAGHRFECIMTHKFGRDVSKPISEMNDWELFTLYDAISNGNSVCGNVHFAPNSTVDYEWGNQTKVYSAWEDWAYNYPNLTGERKLVNASSWGNGDMTAHHKWWFSCVPHVNGVNKKSGAYNNWWVYFLYPVSIPKDVEVTDKDNVSPQTDDVPEEEYWILWAIIPETRVTLDNGMETFCASMTEEEVKNVEKIAADFEKRIVSLSGNQAKIHITTMVSEEPLRKLSDYWGAYWVAPNDLPEEVKKAGEKYDCIMACANLSNDTTCLGTNYWGLSYTQPITVERDEGCLQERYNCCYAFIQFFSKLYLSVPDPEGVWVHEWIHTLEDGIVSDYCTMPSADGSETYGYIQGADGTWNNYYGDILQGKVIDPKTGKKIGMTPEAWRYLNLKKQIKISGHHDFGVGVIIKKATCTEDGIMQFTCNLCHEIQEEQILHPEQLILAQYEAVYCGKAVKPSVLVLDSKGQMIPRECYSLKYKNCKNVGRAEVIVTFQGKYKGQMKGTYIITPRPTKITKIIANKKGFTAKWNKQAEQTSGYQIQYSINGSFKGEEKKTETINSNKTISKSMSNLRSGQEYYVRVRTYKKVKIDGESVKIFSEWSPVKKVITK